MPANLPVAFGALLAGGLLTQKGVEAAKGAFAKGSGSGAGSASAAGPAQAQQMLAAARAAVGGPYSEANHASAIGHVASWLKQFGTDCSGFISYLMGPAGAGLWSGAYATPGIPTAPSIASGPGQYVTLYNNPAPGAAGHVFIEILGSFFESAGGIGIHEMTAGEAQSYLSSHQYTAYHPEGL